VSSTLGRRVRNDDYPSPRWTGARLLDRVRFPAGRWVEPSAGDGELIAEVREHAATRNLPILFDAIELDADTRPLLATRADRVIEGNFLTMALPNVYDVCLGNPPYDDAFAFVQEGLRIARITALLLRSNFLGSAERQAFWQRAMADVNTLPERPTFVTKVRRSKTGKILKSTSDSCDYAWFVWDRTELPRAVGRTQVLDATHPEVRAAARRRAPIVIEQLDGSYIRYEGPPEALGLAPAELFDERPPAQMSLSL
jgi:hypothetical protein